MNLLALYLLFLFLSAGLARVGLPRPLLLAMLPLIFLDCCASVIAGESFHTTLSAKAHNARAKGHRWWGWTASAIDVLFFWQEDHCRVQAEREARHGGVWKSWAADWRAASLPKG
jgi:hypothetical protein